MSETEQRGETAVCLNPKCGRDWHGLPKESATWATAYPNNYHDCPGSHLYEGEHSGTQRTSA